MSRRFLPWIVLLAAILHVVGIARTTLPAQDGLKFIRVAREFGHRPWSDVVRGSDQHPLYPMAIAVLAPVAARLVGPGPDSWRIAAQAVSSIAAVAMLFPLFALSRRWFDERTALLATLLAAVLPATCAIGHDTLSDSLALFAFTTTLWLGERALRTRRTNAMIACGLTAGVGYWVRPELAVLPATIIGVALVKTLIELRTKARSGGDSKLGAEWTPRPWYAEIGTLAPSRWATLAVGFLVVVGGYALVKGEVSEKLALRRGAAISSKPDGSRAVEHWLPPGLDDPRLDFSPKEEAGRTRAFTPTGAVVAVGSAWAEGLGWVFALLAVVGAVRVRPSTTTWTWLALAYLVVFSAILARHAMGLGYLSGRHALTLVVVTLPWAAAGTRAVAGRIAQRLAWDDSRYRRIAGASLAALVVACVLIQADPAHASRWGHRAAGLWLAQNTSEGDAILDTRGWAGFVSGLRSYDYWHVRQALTDQRLSYVVVTDDELRAGTQRAETLRAMLDHAAELVASFPGRREDTAPEVLVFRFTHPGSWEGLAR